VEERPGQRLLRGARELVARSWSRGADARDVHGDPVDPWDERAVGWSLLGSLVAVLERSAAESDDLPLEHLAGALYALAGLVDTDSLAAWNDDPARTQGAVLAALDGAVAVCGDPLPQLISAN
jgi:hypothetical protein